tara:strand:- start:1474 stop:2196 length:723 start_codon:yes stop_codon:yes gene_type:complete
LSLNRKQEPRWLRKDAGLKKEISVMRPLLLFASVVLLNSLAIVSANEPIQVFTLGEKVEATNQTIGCFRIPSLLRTSKNTLLAFAEGRVNGCRPDVAADRPIVVRSSGDDGKTWSSIRIAVPGNATYGLNYPAATLLPDGKIMLLYHVASPGANSQVWRTESSDDGQTWTTPVQTGLPNACAAFPAVTLNQGKKLITPCASFAAISDDGGRTWRRSKGNVSLGINVTGLGEASLEGELQL